MLLSVSHESISHIYNAPISMEMGNLTLTLIEPF